LKGVRVREPQHASIKVIFEACLIAARVNCETPDLIQTRL